jgi:hypothetical protein
MVLLSFGEVLVGVGGCGGLYKTCAGQSTLKAHSSGIRGHHVLHSLVGWGVFKDTSVVVASTVAVMRVLTSADAADRLLLLTGVVVAWLRAPYHTSWRARLPPWPLEWCHSASS